MAINDKYDIVNNTYITKEKEFETEIGDIKQPDFKPQIKIKRWDNEANASFRLIDTSPGIPVVSIKGNKIKWVKDKIEAHFYLKSSDEQNEHGSYEFEIILKEKPVTNKLEFSIETKELNFFYQPELTQEELEEGLFRPENVVGSYAIYHKTKGGLNSINGKDYKAGKAFHIYRPKIIDSIGNWVWGDLNINVDARIQTITIPQDFLDTAVYPIRHAAGETFGFTSMGGTSGTYIANASGDESQQIGFTYALSEDATLDSLHVALISNSGTRTVDLFFALHREDSGGSGTHARVASVEEDDVSYSTLASWKVISAASEVLTADDYIIDAVGNGVDLPSGVRCILRYDSGGASRNSYAEWRFGATSFADMKAEDPWTETASTTTNKYSFYATYTPAAPEAPSIVGWKTLLGVGQG